MSADKPKELPPSAKFLRRADQTTVAALVLFGLVALAGYGWRQYSQHGRLIEIDRVDPQTVQFHVNVNTADWSELVSLPEIGETLAKRIVEYRQQHGPYHTLADIQRVRGIGPKTMERLRPFLTPIQPEQIAGQ